MTSGRDGVEHDDGWAVDGEEIDKNPYEKSMNPGMSAALLKSRVSSSTVLWIPGADIDFIIIHGNGVDSLKSLDEE